MNNAGLGLILVFLFPDKISAEYSELKSMTSTATVSSYAEPDSSAYDAFVARYTANAPSNSETNPLIIYNLNDLLSFRKLVNNGTTFAGKFVKMELSGNIDVGGAGLQYAKNDGVLAFSGSITNAWTPIEGFAGTFDGGYDAGTSPYGIINMVAFNNTAGTFAGVGLFGKTEGATIKNVSIGGKSSMVGAIASGSKDMGVGGIVGIAIDTKVSHCRVTANVFSGNRAGGLIGYVLIKKTNVTVSLTNMQFAGGVYGIDIAGGIVGEVKEHKEGSTRIGDIDLIEMNNCSGAGAIYSVKEAGGLAGILSCLGDVSLPSPTTPQNPPLPDSIKASNCVYSGEIHAGGYAGGIVGSIGSGGSILLDSLTVSSMVYSKNPYYSTAGSIVGEIGSAGKVTIRNCRGGYLVESVGVAGGLVGRIGCAGGVLIEKSAFSSPTGGVYSEDNEAGGIVGNIGTAGEITIREVEAGGVVSGKQSAGGIVGHLGATMSVSVTSTKYTGAGVSSTDDIAGGIAANIGTASPITLTDLSATGDISAKNDVGVAANLSSPDTIRVENVKFIGSSVSSTEGCAGGIVSYLGSSKSPVLANLSASGSIRGSSSTAGIIAIMGIGDFSAGTGDIVASGLHFTGESIVSDKDIAGGIFGSIGCIGKIDLSDMTVIMSKAVGATRSISGKNESGGIAGDISCPGSICLADLEFDGAKITSSDNAAGGIFADVGSGTSISIERAQASGVVEGFRHTGGIGGVIGTAALTVEETAVYMKDLTFIGSSVKSTNSNAGGAIGSCGTSAVISISSLSASGTIEGNNKVGGLLGEVTTKGRIIMSDLTFTGASVESSNSNAGGIAGSAKSDYGLSIDTAEASCIVKGFDHAGGIIGIIEADKNIDIQAMKYKGTSVTSVDSNAGGIIGHLANGRQPIVIEDLSATGDIQARKKAGGVIGNINSGSNVTATNTIYTGDGKGTVCSLENGYEYAGGVFGYVGVGGSIEISSASSDASVEGSNAGGIAGELSAGNYYSPEPSGNIFVYDCDYTGSSVIATLRYGGGIVGMCGGPGLLEMHDVTATGEVGAADHCGGIIGLVGMAKTIDIYDISCDVSSVISQKSDAGGLVGFIGTQGIVTLSNLCGFATVTGDRHAGGIVAEVGTSIGFSMEDVSYTGVLVEATKEKAAGIIAVVGLYGTIEVRDVHVAMGATGEVKGATLAGGIVAELTCQDEISVENLSFSGASISTATGNAGGALGTVASYRKITVSDVKVTGNVSGGNYAGGAFGTVQSGNDIEMKNIMVSNTAVTSNLSYAGGLVGYTSSSTSILLKDADVYADVSSNLNENGTGGIVGYIMSSKPSTIENVVYEGSVLATGSGGGIIGVTDGIRLYKVYAIADVSGGEDAGGLIGGFTNSVRAEQCQFVGSVSATQYAGGLIGGSFSKDAYQPLGKSVILLDCVSKGFVSTTETVKDTYVGGLVGYVGYADVIDLTNAYSICVLSSANTSAGIGGWFGYTEDMLTFSNSYFSSTFAGTTDAVGNQTMTTDMIRTPEELQELTTFETWDFDTIWFIEADNYPGLRIMSRALLQSLIDAYRLLDGSLYHELTWTPFEEALQNAEAALADPNLTDAQAQPHIDEVQDLFERLILKTVWKDWEDLLAACGQAIADLTPEQIGEGNGQYTPETIAAFTDVLEDADAFHVLLVTQTRDYNQDDLLAEIDALQKALDAFLLAANDIDASELEDLIQEAKDLLLNTVFGNRHGDTTVDQEAILTAAIEAAEAVLTTPYTTENIADAVEELQGVIDAFLLSKITVDFSVLEQAVIDGKLIKRETWSLVTWTALQNALLDGDQILTVKHSSQEEVDAAAEAIRKAITLLVQVSTEEAIEEIRDAVVEKLDNIDPNEIGNNHNQIPQEVIDKLIKEQKRTQPIFDNPNSTEEELLQAIEDLQKALDDIERARVRVDFSELVKLIEKAEKLEKKKLTSWDHLMNVLAEAKDMVDKDGVSQAQVDEMVKKLNSAIDAYIKSLIPATAELTDGVAELAMIYLSLTAILLIGGVMLRKRRKFHSEA